MKQYLDLMRLIRDKGVFKEDRTGTGTYSIFAHQMRFDLSEGFPLVSTKKCHLKSIIHELLWFLKGDTNIKYLQDNGVRIWDEWADENGDLGPVYGYQWRSWPDVKVVDQDTADALVNKGGFEDLGPLDSNIDGKGYCHHAAVRRGIDQIQNIIGMLKKGPDSRRIIVSAWNPALVEQMALPPCHALFQFYSAPMSIAERWELLKAQGGPSEKTYDRYREECEEMGYLRGPGISEERYDRNALEDDHRYLDNSYVPRRKLSCQLYQRSADVFLGVPFNIASYALLTMMVAKVTDHAYGDFIWTGGDCHLYTNHLEQADLQMAREPRSLPVMKIKDRGQDLFGFEYDDFILEGYDPHPHIAGKVAV